MSETGVVQHVTLERTSLPVLHTADVVVVGGSFGGVSAALSLAQAGREVVLIELRTYLGSEVTATLRPWFRIGEDTGEALLPEVVRACLRECAVGASDGEVPLRMGRVKTCLEDLLLAAGVRLVYASVPVGLCVREGKLGGLVVANKPGRQVLSCLVAVDATETGLLARLAGAQFEASAETSVYSCTLEWTGVRHLDERFLKVPEDLGLVDDAVVVHTGHRGEGHVLLEARLALSGRVEDPLQAAQRGAVASRKLAGLAEHLVWQESAFEHAYPAGASYELHGPHAQPMRGAVPEWAQGLEASLVVDGIGANVPAAAFAGPVPGVWCLNGAARLSKEARSQFGDPIIASQLGETFAHVLVGHWNLAAGAADVRAETTATDPPEAGSYRVEEQSTLQSGRRYGTSSVAPLRVPVLRSADVLVVGGGSSGAVAGIVSGQEGLHTVLVDMNPGLGGTGTYGGIYTYWFARRIGFVDTLMSWLDRAHDRLRLPRPKGVMARWNILARVWALLEQAEAAGVEVLPHATAFATVMEEQRVHGVVVATRLGPVALLGTVTIDGTGDGDVAAHAGAECVYGSEREQEAECAHMPQLEEPGRPRNGWTSQVDVRSVEDYTRMILSERRRARPGDHDQGLYLAPRESRHVLGEVVMTLGDQLMRRCWPDVALIAFSNYDMKGQSGSDFVRMGLQPPNLEMEVPFRALIPKSIEGLIVVGKAFSATHDAQAAPRMQPDLENLGGVGALVASMAVHSGTAPRGIDVGALQARLVERGVLPERVLTRKLVPLHYTDEQLQEMIEALTAERSLHAYSDAEIGEPYEGRIPPVDIMCAGARVVPMLEDALSVAEGARRVLLAQLGTMVGSKQGVSVLISAIEHALTSGQLSPLEDTVRHAELPPDQGGAPGVAHWLYTLGLAGDRRALPVLEKVVDLLATSTKADVFSRSRGHYYYVSAVCYGAERLGDRDAIPLLSRLHSYGLFHGLTCTRGFQVNHLDERLSTLELLIGRALARNGSGEGYTTLIGYLQDVRASLAGHAHSELVALVGHDLGEEPAAWSRWLEDAQDALEPTPWDSPTEAMTTWQEAILTEAERAY